MSVVHCDSCKNSRFCALCLGVGATQGATGSVRCDRCLGTGKCPECQKIRLLDLAQRPQRFLLTTGDSSGEVGLRVGRYPRGVVRQDDEVHAVRRWVGGDQALCGAGPIATRLSGQFVPGAPGSCADCGYHVGR